MCSDIFILANITSSNNFYYFLKILKYYSTKYFYNLLIYISLIEI